MRPAGFVRTFLVIMDANELMIGNYVYLKKGNESKRYRIDGFDLYKLDECDCKDIYPIPLTEDILLQFGFYEIGNNGFMINNTFMFTLGEGSLAMARPDCFSSNEKSIPFAWIKNDIIYVHQLQNLYFALTNEELNIEL